MYVQSEDFSSISSIITGFDLGSQDGILTAFQEWLVQEYNLPSNLSWTSGILQLAGLDTQKAGSLSREAGNQATEKMFEIFSIYETFLDYQKDA